MSEEREPHLLTRVDGAVLIATLNNPEKLNPLGAELLGLFEQALHRFRDSPELKVMLINAKGRYFTAGADMRSGGTPPPPIGSAIRESHRRGLNGMHRIYDEMEAIEKPIVVAHHAMCVGGGIELSLSCDFRLAAKNAGYAFPEGKFGTIPASNGVSRSVRILGTHWARWLVMTNLPITAEKAMMMGLVHEVYPDETFEADTLAFCHHLAAQNGEQLGVAKLAIELAADVGLAQARNVERMANSTLMMHPDYQAGMEKYLASGFGKKG